MEITEVKVFPVDEEKLKAFVSVVIDDCFMVNDIKIICGRDGLFISMPSRRKKNGKFKDVAHPLNNETRQTLEMMILAEYERLLAEEGSTATVVAPELSPTVPPIHTEPEKPATAWEATEDTATDLEDVTRTHLRDSFWTS